MTIQDPGWYPDPLNETARMRWWDGNEWGDATQPRTDEPAEPTTAAPTEQFGAPPTQQWSAAGPPPPPVKKNRRPALIVAGVIVAAVVVVGIVGAVNSKDKDSTSSASSDATTTTTAVTTTTVDPAVAAAEEASASSQAAADASAAAAAAAARQREAAAKLDRSTYNEVGDRGWALIAKDPDAHVGEKVKLYGKVTQFDSATGTTIFRADTEGEPKDNGFEYNVNTVVDEGTPGAFDEVVEDDLFTAYATVSGSKTYDTTMGGSTTVPEIEVYVIDVTGSDR